MGNLETTVTLIESTANLPPVTGPENKKDNNDAEEDEESMDWWTKYFASIDTMIEVSLMKENKAFSFLLSSDILVQMMFKAGCL